MSVHVSICQYGHHATLTLCTHPCGLASNDSFALALVPSDSLCLCLVLLHDILLILFFIQSHHLTPYTVLL